MSLSLHRKQVSPHDGFCVIRQYHHQAIHDEILSRLFTPLIGAEAIGIYQFLSQFNQPALEEKYTHYIMMSELKMGLAQIRENLDLLEGIGLVRTYVKHSETVTQFVYQLLPPPNARDFFNDPLLSIYFYQVVGQQRYHQLKSYFILPEVDLTGFADMTKKFTDVFKVPKQQPKATEKGLDEAVYDGVDLTDVSFDFELLADMLQTHYISKAILSEPTKSLIVQLATLYRLSPDVMKTLILKSINSDQSLSVMDLRKQAQNYFLMENHQELPALQSVKPQSTAHHTENDTEPNEVTSWDDWFALMDHTSPVVMLTSYSGSEPPLYQKKMIEELVQREGFSFGVINVLLQYVMQKLDKNLPEKYVYSVASSWKKHGIHDAKSAYEKAMDIQRNETRKREKQQQPKSKPYTYKQAPVYEEKPRWITHPEEFQKKEEDQEALARDREAFLKSLQKSKEVGDEE
ncbi:replication initiation and membrane attachment family protein [Staphylococcus sp. 17KM0847]|uniref:replication initiation and membrane attachment family protein n=1 Tax=Staphylococcus sp. 17KM0847 TaxID=2583989 RepID=UPI0015DC4495|nr:DnaD domain protein [Staphylococcus sp. 17KM0847]QLK85953.1 helicase DnaB [Staphylococcus sp. 17KM0847]